MNISVSGSETINLAYLVVFFFFLGRYAGLRAPVTEVKKRGGRTIDYDGSIHTSYAA